MSSGSDDLDEDELLQIALKEQAQRDLNYHQRPPSNNSRKPVANYVQPPPQPIPRKTAAGASPANNLHARKPSSHGSSRRGGVNDDDDDSEVEMLSISSGDEDSTSREHQRGPSIGGSRGRAGSSARVGAQKDDDALWDGEEPDCWKRVEEAEVRRFEFFW